MENGIKQEYILFGKLNVEKIEPKRKLEECYAEYADTFNHIAEGLALVMTSERNRREETMMDEEFENRLSEFFNPNNSPDYSASILTNRYHSFISEYIKLIESNPQLHQELSGKGFEIGLLEELNYMDQYADWPFRFGLTPYTTYALQFVGCSYMIVERLWDVYQFVTKRSNDVYELVHDGCKLIGYTWQDYFRTLRYIPRMPYLIVKAVASFTIGIPMLGKRLTKRFDRNEQLGAAFADYPYHFENRGTIEIKPIPKNGRNVVGRIKQKYKETTMKLDLNDKYGLAVALFDCKEKGTGMRCVSFAGTRLGIKDATKRSVMVQNILTDILQYIEVPSRIYFEAVAVLNDVMKSFPFRKIYVFGHSLGGGLMQYACAMMNDRKLYGYGYNSAGLSDNTIKTIPGYNKMKLQSHVEHLCSLHDPVSRLGHQVSEVKYVESGRGWAAHGLVQLNKMINGGTELRCNI